METTDLAYDLDQDMAGPDDAGPGPRSKGAAGLRAAWLTPPAPGGLSAWPIGLALVAGVLLGWLVIGWWLWPVRWVGCAPQDLDPAWQERYVALVAAEHWRSGDADQARAALAGWDGEALSALLSTMERQAADSDARAQLSALRTAVALAPARNEPSLWTSLIKQKAIYWSASLAAFLLASAVALAAAGPRLICALKGGEAGQGADGQLADQEELALAPWLEGLDDEEDEAFSLSAGAQDEDGAGGGGDSTASAAEQTRVDAGGGDQEGGEAGALRTRMQAPPAEAGEPRVRQATRRRARDHDAQRRPEDGRKAGEESAVEAATTVVLSDLVDDVKPADPYREALARMIEAVSIDELEQQAIEVMAQMRALAGAAARRCAHDLRN